MKYITFDIETTGLDPNESEVTCICAKNNKAGFLKISNFIQGDTKYEQEKIDDFFRWILKQNHHNLILVSKNGKGFDLPFLFKRFIAHANYDEYYNKINSIKHIDLQSDIIEKRLSLNELAKLFNCPLKINDGLGAIELFNTEQYEELERYCWQDVIITEQIFKKMVKLGTIKLTG